MLHLPKLGYIFGYNIVHGEYQFVGSYGAIKQYLNPTKITFFLDKDDLKNLCFVHGSLEQLYEGKPCVVRETVEQVKSSGYVSPAPDKVCIHLKSGGVLLIVGKTGNGNSKIILKV